MAQPQIELGPDGPKPSFPIGEETATVAEWIAQIRASLNLAETALSASKSSKDAAARVVAEQQLLIRQTYAALADLLADEHAARAASLLDDIKALK